ncbi:MAG: PPC domain-containing protein [Bryobacter sp.]|nr:PPC domain-containing protein [Bryobacter sp.]
MKLAALVLFALTLSAQHPTGPRITPPTLSAVSPRGFPRGLTAELTVEGFNLAGASRILFSQPYVTGKILQIKELPDAAERRLGSNGTESTIDLGPLPPRNRVRIELDIAANAPVGPVDFRLVTPLGTSPTGRIAIEPFWGEVADSEPNDDFAQATGLALPALLSGAISRSGDVDTFKFRGTAGQELVFDNGALDLGSTLQPLYRLYDSNQKLLHEAGHQGLRSARSFAFRLPADGEYFLQIADFALSGRASNFYRLKLGGFPLVTGAFPLGLPRNGRQPLTLSGFQLPAAPFAAQGTPSPDDEFSALLRPLTPQGPAFNEIRLALGDYPEQTITTNSAPLAIPSIMNGHLAAPATFTFSAREGEELIFEVLARRVGVDLDSELEVLDASGQPVETAVLRPVWETNVTLRDHDSTSRGIRITAWNALAVGDYLQIGSEVIRLEELPRGPDDDSRYASLRGQRLAFFNTSPEAHAIDSPVYKVEVHPPGSQFSPNGLPLTRLYARNDDGGPGYGKDSLLRFRAPRSGQYQLRLRDMRGVLSSPRPYRLTARRPAQDFRLSFSPANPNLPPGATIPLSVSATRLDGFDGPISLSLEGLPPAVTASPAFIAPGQLFATILLTSQPDANLSGSAHPIRVFGHAVSNLGRQLRREASSAEPLAVLSGMPPADVSVTTLTKTVEIEAGSTAEVSLEIARHNGFAGRVPVSVMNLPPSVRVLDVGLNGVLLNENENRRSFTLAALPDSPELEQLIYLGGAVETRSPQQNTFAAPTPVILRVKVPKKSLSSHPNITGELAKP